GVDVAVGMTAGADERTPHPLLVLELVRDGVVHHRRQPGGVSSVRTSHTAGAAAVSESSRSIIPPCPGTSEDMSLTPRSRLSADSTRSPRVPTTAATVPASTPCHQ